MQYLNYVNEYRTFVDWEEVENVIVDDFIKLDSFIHEIKWSLYEQVKNYIILLLMNKSIFFHEFPVKSYVI